MVPTVLVLLIIPGIGFADWLSSGDSSSGVIALISLPFSVLGVSVMMALGLRSQDKSRRDAITSDTPSMIGLTVLLGSLLGVFFGAGAMLVATYGHYLNLTFAEMSGGDAGLSQRGVTLFLPALVVEFGAIGLTESKGKSFAELLPSWKIAGLLAIFLLWSYGLGFLGDVGHYLWLVSFIVVLLPWEIISEKVQEAFRRKPDSKGLTTTQLSILWCGSIAAIALCVVWVLVANSVGPSVLAIVILTAALVLSTGSSANKLAVAATVGALLLTAILLPTGFFVYQYATGSAESIQPEQIEITNVEWSRLDYTGVILFTAHIKNTSSYNLTSFDLELTMTEPGHAPEVFSDTVELDLLSGQDKAVKHYFARPTLGRDIANFFQMRASIDDAAQLSWRVTGAKAVAQ